MNISHRNIDQASSDLKETYGGVKEDYFALLYLQDEFGLPPDEAALQIAFGGDDYGVDAFHLDAERRNLYLLQFKWSSSYNAFKTSYERSISDGIERVVGNPTQDQHLNPVLMQLKSRLLRPIALTTTKCLP